MTQQLRDSQAEGAKLNLLNRYKRCIIRIQFPPPDSLVIQGTFSITESISDVIQFVKNFMQVRKRFALIGSCVRIKYLVSKIELTP